MNEGAVRLGVQAKTIRTRHCTAQPDNPVRIHMHKDFVQDGSPHVVEEPEHIYESHNKMLLETTHLSMPFGTAFSKSWANVLLL